MPEQRRPGPPPDWTHLRLWEIALVRDVAWVALAVAGLALVYYLRDVFVPLLIAFLLAYVCRPIVTNLRRRCRVPPALSTALLLVFFVAAGAGLTAWLGPKVARQAAALAERAPQYAQALSERYEIQLPDWKEDLQRWGEQTQREPRSLLAGLLAGARRALGLFGTALGVTTQLVIGLVLIPVYFFFFSWRFERLAEVKQLVPARHRERFLRTVGEIDRAFAGFFRGRCLVALIMTVMFCIGWALADVPYWFLVSAASGLLSLIPYAAALGWIAAVFLKYLDMTAGPEAPGFDWLAVFIWPSLVYLAVQAIEGWLITPWVQSRSTALRPATVILAVLIGGLLGGLLGMLLAIPVTASLKILSQEFLLPRIKSQAPDA
jgi:predicted PurR-regulated permease PerM